MNILPMEIGSEAAQPTAFESTLSGTIINMLMFL